MSIELVTGIPGNGKTLYVLSTVSKRAAAENRPVYYHGIAELKLPWEEMDDPKSWASVPPGAIVVIDEAQKTFRNRSLGTVPPSFVTELETHRHLGIDLVLITQHPSLVDPAVRRLAGSHKHLVRIWGMEASTVHEWHSVKDNCDKSRADSMKSKWAFDRSMYGMYKSSELHTIKRSIPFRVKMLLCLPFLLLAAGWYMYTFVAKKTTAVPAVAGQVAASPGAPPSTPGAPGSSPPPFDPVADARAYALSRAERVVGLPHTAPVYDGLTKPVRVPVPAACVQVRRHDGDRCKCYTQQGTPMKIEYDMCVSIARDGYFQDFDADPQRAGQVGETPMAQRQDLAPVVADVSRVTVIPYTPDPPRSGRK